jgi:hypothetical protein
VAYRRNRYRKIEHENQKREETPGKRREAVTRDNEAVRRRGIALVGKVDLAARNDSDRRRKKRRPSVASTTLPSQNSLIPTPIQAPVPATHSSQCPLAVRDARTGFVRVEVAGFDGEEDGTGEEDKGLFQGCGVTEEAVSTVTGERQPG